MTLRVTVLRKEAHIRSIQRNFKIAMLILTITPILFCISAITNSYLSGTTNPIIMDMDSNYRYLGGVYLALLGGFIYIVLHLEKYRTLFRIFLVAMVVGGLARIPGFVIMGWPSKFLQLLFVIELIGPALLFYLHNQIFPKQST